MPQDNPLQKWPQEPLPTIVSPFARSAYSESPSIGTRFAPCPAKYTIQFNDKCNIFQIRFLISVQGFLTWTSEGEIENVKIEYLNNNGGEWLELEAKTENDGSYDWEVPCDLSDKSLTRISDVDSEASDTSDGVFSIIDDIAPNIEVSVTPDILWPPNHKMVPVTTNVTVHDNCDAEPTFELVSIIRDENDETRTYDPNYDFSVNDGHTSDDIQIIDKDSFYLSLERSGRGG